MASMAEQLAANMSFSALANSQELKNRIWFTLGALIVYRLGSYIPMPGIDSVALEQFAAQNSAGILGWMNSLAGGALGRMAIFALNVMPYISASIIIQLMTSVSPTLEALKKEGESGRKKINQYTRYFTVLLAAMQAYGIAVGLEGQGSIVTDPGMFFRASTVITLTGGTLFLMWLGEQITSRGIGKRRLAHHLCRHRGQPSACHRGHARVGPHRADVVLPDPRDHGHGLRRHRLHRAGRARPAPLLIQYPKRQVGMKMTQADSSHLPIKINTAGVIPPIFASSLLLLPITVANFSAGKGPEWLNQITALLGHGRPLYLVLFAALIVFFSFFQTSIMFNPKETAENLKKSGGFILGIRPGEKTAEYLDWILTASPSSVRPTWSSSVSSRNSSSAIPASRSTSAVPRC